LYHKHLAAPKIRTYACKYFFIFLFFYFYIFNKSYINRNMASQEGNCPTGKATVCPRNGTP
jgi:hypothetical protein